MTENAQQLPYELVEACGGPPLRPPGLDEVIRCISCLAARSEDGMPIVPAAVLSCRSGLNHSAVDRSFNKLEEEDIIQPTASKAFISPPVGNWKLERAQQYELTERGRDLMPVQAQEDCRIRNPLVRATPDQARVIACARCILARTAETSDEPSFLIEQIVACQSLVRSRVNKIVYALWQAKLLIKTVVHGWKKGKQAFRYTLGPKALPWMAPQLAEHCPSKGAEAPLPKVSPERERVLGCMACLFGASRNGEDADRLRQTTVAACLGDQSNRRTVQGAFDRSVREGLLEKRPLPGSKKTDYYVATEAGERFFSAVPLPETCPSGRRRLVEPPLPTSEPDAIKYPLAVAAAFRALPSKTFANGAELLDYLAQARYGQQTYLHLLVEIIENYARNRMSSQESLHPSDTVQEILLAIAKRQTAITFPDKLHYIFGIASNKVSDTFREVSRRRARTVSLDDKAIKIDEFSYALDDPNADTPIGRDLSIDPQVLVKGIKTTPLNIALIEAMAIGTDGHHAIDTAAIAAQFGMTTGAVRIAFWRLRAKLRQNEELQKAWKDLTYDG